MTRKKVVTVVVIVAVLLGGIFVWKSCSGASKKDQLQLESVVVDKGSISTSITATGNIKLFAHIARNEGVFSAVYEKHRQFCFFYAFDRLQAL